MMNEILLAATNQGLLIYVHDRQEWRFEGRSLSGRKIACVISKGEIILAGTREGIFRSLDKGLTYQPANTGLSHHHIRWLSFLDTDNRIVLAGTEPAAIFVSEDGGEFWHNCPEVEGFREQHGWYLPYSPEAGCVRGFASHGKTVFAAVEVGGVLRSDNSGKNWKFSSDSESLQVPGPHKRGQWIHPDVHSIEVHPKFPDMIYAPTGGGFYRSMDGGVSWVSYYSCYCRAVWIDRDNPNRIILGPADNVDRNGRIEASRDGGVTWEVTSNGLEIPWERHMVERFHQVGNEIMAVLSNGSLIHASIDSLNWLPLISNVERVNAVAALEI